MTSFVRRRNRKRLLAEASNFFDPRGPEDTSEEKNRSGLFGPNSSGHGHSEYPSDSRVVTGLAGVSTGSISRPGPAHSPPVPAHALQDYIPYDGGNPGQYYNMGNVPAGHSSMPNPYDLYGPRNGYGQYDPPNSPGFNGERPSMADHGSSIPHQLQPGVYSTQGAIFTSRNTPPLRTQPTPLTTSPPPAHSHPSVSNERDLPRIPVPSPLPETFGHQESGDDDAYGGAFLGPDSPPQQRTLHVSFLPGN